MNTCELERIDDKITFTYFPGQSRTSQKNQNTWCDISVIHPQTVMIRAIDPQKWQQIADHPLTERELCILKMIANGKSNPAIAEDLFITVGTVKTHVRNILCKLDVNDRTQAAVLALRSGLVD